MSEAWASLDGWYHPLTHVDMVVEALLLFLGKCVCGELHADTCTSTSVFQRRQQEPAPGGAEWWPRVGPRDPQHCGQEQHGHCQGRRSTERRLMIFANVPFFLSFLTDL